MNGVALTTGPGGLMALTGAVSQPVLDAYFHGERLRVLVSNERGDITGEPLFAESKITQIIPAMEDVFSYFVKNESGKEMKGGRISGSGQSTIKLENLDGGKKTTGQTATKE